MRNLKRALSLALASVMLLGMMVIGTSAASTNFTDDADIVNTEAAAVTAGLGIFAGADGKFMPEKTVTRAEMATIIVKMLYGSNVNADIYKGIKTFSDIADYQGGWAEGYINLCESLGIVSGYGDGTFKPGNPVNTAEAATMIINALGIDAGEGTWPATVMSKAAEKKLFGSLQLAAYNELSRDNLAVLVLEGLKYDPKGTTVNYTVEKDDKVLLTTADYLEAYIYAMAVDGEVGTSSISTESLGYKVFGLKKSTKTDDFGRVSTTYINEKAEKETIYAKIAPTAALEYTKAVKLGDIVKALGFNNVSDEIKLNVIVNGAADEDKSEDKANKTTSTEIGGKGVKVEVYKKANKEYDVIVIETFVKTLVSGDITKAVAATATEDAKKAFITLEGKDYPTDAFKADDVVLYTKKVDENGDTAKIVDVVKASAVSGYVTATASGYFRVDGEKKELAAETDATYVIGADEDDDTTNIVVDAKKAYTYYTDANGYVYAIKEGKSEDVKTDYIYVIAQAAKAATSKAGDLFAASTDSAAAAQLKVINLTTGEISVVDRAIVKSSGKYYYANTQGAASATEVADIKAADGAVNAIYEYVVLADGTYALGEAADLASVEVKKNTAVVAEDLYANASTELKVVTLTKDSKGVITSAAVTVTTGIANFPATAKTYANTVITSKSGVVSALLTVVDKAPETQAVKYAIYKGAGETTAAGTNVAFYVDGAVVEYTLKKDFAPELDAGTVYAIELESGKLSKADPASAKESSLKVTIVADSYVVAGGKVVYLKDATVVVDAGASYAKAELAKDDVITVYGAESLDAGKGADFIVIAKDAE